MATWATHSTPNTGSTIIYDAACAAPHKFVMVGSLGTSLYSHDDGETWTVVAMPGAATSDWFAVAVGGTTLIAVGNDPTYRMARSTDYGVTWTGKTMSNPVGFDNVCWCPTAGLWIAVSTNFPSSAANEIIATSADDGNTWSAQTVPVGAVDYGWNGIRDSGSVITVAATISIPARTLTSTDGISWTYTASVFSAGQAGTPNGVGSNVMVYSTELSQFVVAGQKIPLNEGELIVSTDGVSWATLPDLIADGTTSWIGLLSFVAADAIGGFIGWIPAPNGSGSYSVTSPYIGYTTDGGVTWTFDNTTFGGGWSPAAWDNDTGTFVAWDANQTNTVLVGAFGPFGPTIVSVSPDHGTRRGGTLITITGTDLEDVAQGEVLFGGSAASGVTPASDGLSLTCRTPVHAAGSVDVSVTGGNTLTNAYTFVSVDRVTPDAGTTAGGDAVTITGVGLSFHTGDPLFDTTVATGVVFVNDTTITAVTPRHTTGRVNVTVPGVETLKGGYTYGTPPDTLPPLPIPPLGFTNA